MSSTENQGPENLEIEAIVKTEQTLNEDELSKIPSLKEDTPVVKRQKSEGTAEPSVTTTAPMCEIVGGSSVRQYLNKNLTEPLLEGLRIVGREKPEDPLRWLGQFLLDKSSAINNPNDKAQPSSTEEPDKATD